MRSKLASFSLLALIGALSAPTTVRAQYELPLIDVEIDLTAFGLSRPEDVRRGRISVVYGRDSTHLVTYYVRDTPTAPRITYPDPPPTPEPVVGAELTTRQTALWVWRTEEILLDPAERTRFLDFIEAQSITRVFLLIPPAQGETFSNGYVPFSSAEMGPLLADLRARGALAYALDGDKEYVLKENHAGVFRTVRRVVEHNATVPVEQRFHGVRFDIEPYLVEGFQGSRRDELLNGYVELLAGVSEIAHQGDLAVAVDIPFWFDAPDEETGVYMEAELGGERRPMIEHIMSLVDDIAIMDYRTDAMGPNGALAHAYHELELAEKEGVDVFVGVETVWLPDEDLLTFFGPVSEGLPADAASRWIVLEQGADDRTRLWVVDSEEALAELSERTAGATLLRHWPAGRPIRVAADGQTYFNLGPERMRSVTRQVIRHLLGEPAFVGLAFHDYRGLSDLLSNH